MDIAWIPALIGAAIAFALGAVWYNEKVFGKIFMQAQAHRSMEELQAQAPKALMVQGVYTLVLAFFVAALYDALFIFGVVGIALVLLLNEFANSMFNGHPFKVALVNMAYSVVMVVVIALAVAHIPL